jgi:hypothetical protein
MTTNPKQWIENMGEMECDMYEFGYGHVTHIKAPNSTIFPKSDNTLLGDDDDNQGETMIWEFL